MRTGRRLKGRIRRWAAVAGLGLLGLLVPRAGAATAYDYELLVPAESLGINSAGAVLSWKLNPDGWYWHQFWVTESDGTYHTLDFAQEGWDTIWLWWGNWGETARITDPLPGASLGIVWGTGTRPGDLPAPWVWNPATGVFAAVPLPEGVTQAEPIDVDDDGWLHCQGDGTVFAVLLTDLQQVSVASLAGATLAQGREVTNLYWPRRHVQPGPIQVLVAEGAYHLWDRTTGDVTPLAEGDAPWARNRMGEMIGSAGGDAAFWAADGTRTLLHDAVPGAPEGAYVWDLTDSGWVVGQFWTTGFPADPSDWAQSVFAWRPATSEFHDLSAEVESMLQAGGLYSRPDLDVLGGALPRFVNEDGAVFGDLWVGSTVIDPETAETWTSIAGRLPFVWRADAGLVTVDPTHGPTPVGVGTVTRGGLMYYCGPGSYWGVSGVYAWQRSPEGVVEDTLATDAFTHDLSDPPERLHGNDLGQLATEDFRITPRGAMAPGTGVEIQPNPETTITFDNVLTPGVTSVLTYGADDPGPPPVPVQFEVAGLGALLNISTTATFSGSISLSIQFDGTGMTEAQKLRIRLLHYEGGAWVDASDYGRPGGPVDAVNDVVYGRVESFSPFAIVEIVDLTPPEIEAPSATTLVTDCEGSALAVTPALLGVTVADDTDETPTVSVSPASLLPGTTPVTIRAKDHVGNESSTEVSVTVLRGAFAARLQDPLEAGVDNQIRAGRVVPVKVELLCGNAAETGARVTLHRVDEIDASGNVGINTVPETEDLSEDAGNLFHLTGDMYHFNLSTKGWASASGKRFRVTVKATKAGHVDTYVTVVLANR